MLTALASLVRPNNAITATEYFMFLINQNIITKLNGIIINLMEKR